MQTREIAHNWMHGQRPTQCGNVFYEGDAIFSYGRHFCMAQKRELKNGSVILVNSDSYSTSTARHQSYVRQAIYGRYILVPDLKRDEPIEEVAQKLFDKVDQYLHESAKPRIRQATRDQKEGDAQDAYNTYREFCTVAGIRPKKHKLLEVPTAERQAAYEKQAKAKVAAAKRADAKREKENAEAIADWQKGIRWECPYTEYPKLRVVRSKDISGEVDIGLDRAKVETSRGVMVDAADVIKYWPIICRSKKNLTEHVFPGVRIGPYPVDRLDRGDLTVGCHILKFEEMNRIAPQLGLEALS